MSHLDHSTIIYRKLFRDLIPEIIWESVKTPHVCQQDGLQMAVEIGRKIREEVSESLRAWKSQNPDGILKEGADILEILLAALHRYGLSVQDLLRKTKERRKERGPMTNDCS